MQTKTETKTIKNENVIIMFYEKREYQNAYIYFKNLNDIYNEETGYTRKVRNIALAWKFIEQIFESEELKDDLNFSDIRKILDEKFNLNVHTYYAMD